MKFFKVTLVNKLAGLSIENKRDYRFIPFGFVILYTLALIYSEFHYGSYAVIAEYFCIHPIPYFIDLKVLLCGVDAIRQNADPYTAICYEGSPFFNYPYAWGFLSYLPFMTTANAMQLGFALALLLFVSLYFFIGRINLFQAIIFTLILIAPAVMLGVERANCDLIVLLLFMLSIRFMQSRGLFAFIVLGAAMLKLFPIGAIMHFFNDSVSKLKRTLLMLGAVMSIFIIYLYIMKDNIMMVSAQTPRPYHQTSYGLGALPSMASEYFAAYSRYIFIIFILFMILGFIIFQYLTNKRTARLEIDGGRKGMAYIIGACIYLTTCVIGYNWEYRLVFLVLTIPQILIWIRGSKPRASVILLLTLLIVWQSGMEALIDFAGIKYTYTAYLVLGKMFVIALFFCHSSVMVNFIFNYYKKLSQQNTSVRT